MIFLERDSIIVSHARMSSHFTSDLKLGQQVIWQKHSVIACYLLILENVLNILFHNTLTFFAIQICGKFWITVSIMPLRVLWTVQDLYSYVIIYIPWVYVFNAILSTLLTIT